MNQILQELKAPTKQKKTPQHKIDKASARYHAHKEDVLKMAALKNICEFGRLPFQSTVVKHNLNWEDMAHCLESYIKEHPVTENQRQRVIEEKREVRDFHRFVSANRNQGNRDDDLTILNKVYINAHECAMCKTPFHGKRKIMNADEATGLLRFVLCVPCSIGHVEETTVKLDQELTVEKIDLANPQEDENLQDEKLA
jgi:hypothetical protein